MKADAYQVITDRVMALLQQGTIPWQKPWQGGASMPHNLISRKQYRGVNVFLLHAMSYGSPYWLTYRQAQALGGNVRKGEKACPVVFWKWLDVGAAYLCGNAGIVDRTVDNSAAYIQGWLARLKNDARLVVQAAAQAQKAADFILGVQYEAQELEEAA